VLRTLQGAPHEGAGGEGSVRPKAEAAATFVDPEHDLEVTASGDVLVIRAQHTDTQQDKHRSEFRYGAFQRIVQLPFPVPEEGVDATCHGGILTLRVPMPTSAKETVRTIPVQKVN
jgi:HSP20 family molecular chaperone IbpA